MKRVLSSDDDEIAEDIIQNPIFPKFNEILLVDTIDYIFGFATSYTVVLRCVCKGWRMIVDRKDDLYKPKIEQVPVEDSKPDIFQQVGNIKNPHQEINETLMGNERILENHANICRGIIPVKKGKLLSDECKQKFGYICDIFFDCLATYMNNCHGVMLNNIGNDTEEDDPSFFIEKNLERKRLIENSTDLMCWLLETRAYFLTRKNATTFEGFFSTRFTAYYNKHVISLNSTTRQEIITADTKKDIIFWILNMKCSIDKYMTGDQVQIMRSEDNEDFTISSKLGVPISFIDRTKSREIYGSLLELYYLCALFWNDFSNAGKMFRAAKRKHLAGNKHDMPRFPARFLTELVLQGNDQLFLDSFDMIITCLECICTDNIIEVIENGSNVMLKFLLDKLSKIEHPSPISNGRWNMKECLAKCIERCDIEKFSIVWEYVHIPNTRAIFAMESLILLLLKTTYIPDGILSNNILIPIDEAPDYIDKNMTRKHNFFLFLVKIYCGHLSPMDRTICLENIFVAYGRYLAKGLINNNEKFLNMFAFPIFNTVLRLVIENRSKESAKLFLYRNDWLGGIQHHSTVELILRICPDFYTTPEGNNSIFDLRAKPSFRSPALEFLMEQLNVICGWSMEKLQHITSLGYSFTTEDLKVFLSAGQIDFLKFATAHPRTSYDSIITMNKVMKKLRKKHKKFTIKDKDGNCMVAELTKVIEDAVVKLIL